MAQRKVYSSGNYIYVVELDTTLEYSGGKSNFEFRRKRQGSTIYEVYNDEMYVTQIDSEDTLNINDVLYGDSAFTIWKELNSGFNYGGSNPNGSTDIQNYFGGRGASITGGGLISCFNYSVKWTQRFVLAGCSKDANIPSGYFDIEVPPVGTDISSWTGVDAKLTVTSSGIPLPSWGSLWYQLPIGLDSVSKPFNFYWSSHQSAVDFTIPAGFILVAQRNDELTGVSFCNGTFTDNRGDLVGFNFHGNGPWIALPSVGTETAVRNGLQMRFENYGDTVRMRGAVTPTNNTASGLGSEGTIGTITDNAYKPAIPGYYSNDQPNASFLCGTSKLDAVVGTSVVSVDCATGVVKFGQQSTDNHFLISVDVSWSVNQTTALISNIQGRDRSVCSLLKNKLLKSVPFIKKLLNIKR